MKTIHYALKKDKGGSMSTRNGSLDGRSIGASLAYPSFLVREEKM